MPSGLIGRFDHRTISFAACDVGLDTENPVSPCAIAENIRGANGVRVRNGALDSFVACWNDRSSRGRGGFIEK